MDIVRELRLATEYILPWLNLVVLAAIAMELRNYNKQ